MLKSFQRIALIVFLCFTLQGCVTTDTYQAPGGNFKVVIKNKDPLFKDIADTEYEINVTKEGDESKTLYTDLFNAQEFNDGGYSYVLKRLATKLKDQFGYKGPVTIRNLTYQIDYGFSSINVSELEQNRNAQNNAQQTAQEKAQGAAQSTAQEQAQDATFKDARTLCSGC